LKDHESLAVTNGKLYWHSHNIGGRTAIDYLMNVCGYDFINAVLIISDKRPYINNEKLVTTANVKNKE
jgi:hypothetical protein